jgi:hypothetical protein
MHLVQILLPLQDGGDNFNKVRTRLLEKFGGVTAFTRSPAVGLWEPSPDDVVEDEIVILEVMADHLDKSWWRDYRKELERLFKQDEIVIRSHVIETL